MWRRGRAGGDGAGPARHRHCLGRAGRLPGRELWDSRAPHHARAVCEGSCGCDAAARKITRTAPATRVRRAAEDRRNVRLGAEGGSDPRSLCGGRTEENARCKMQNEKCKMTTAANAPRYSFYLLHFSFCVLQSAFRTESTPL